MVPFCSIDKSTNMVERWQGILKERTKVMKGLKIFESMERFLDGWVIHYYFFRPHLSLNY
jgi:transposase-like protein